MFYDDLIFAITTKQKYWGFQFGEKGAIGNKLDNYEYLTRNIRRERLLKYLDEYYLKQCINRTVKCRQPILQ